MSVNKTMTRMETLIRNRFSRAEDIVKYFSDNDMLPDNNTWQIQENDLTELGLSSSEARIFLKGDCSWLEAFLQTLPPIFNKTTTRHQILALDFLDEKDLARKCANGKFPVGVRV